MDREHFLKSFVAATFSIERLYDSYIEVSACLASKARLLEGPLPFTLRDEIELHQRVIANADTGISLISTLQKLSLSARLEFPIAHDLIRIFRDRNHHVEYEPFKPIKCQGRTDFLVWPVLHRFPAVKQKYPVWSAKPKSLTLSVLLQRNQEYLTIIANKAAALLASSGLQGAIYSKYLIGEFSFGEADKDSWNEG